MEAAQGQNTVRDSATTHTGPHLWRHACIRQGRGAGKKRERKKWCICCWTRTSLILPTDDTSLQVEKKKTKNSLPCQLTTLHYKLRKKKQKKKQKKTSWEKKKNSLPCQLTTLHYKLSKQQFTVSVFAQLMCFWTEINQQKTRTEINTGISRKPMTTRGRWVITFRRQNYYTYFIVILSYFFTHVFLPFFAGLCIEWLTGGSSSSDLFPLASGKSHNPTKRRRHWGPYAPQGSSTSLLSKLSVTSKVSARTSCAWVGSRVIFEVART